MPSCLGSFVILLVVSVCVFVGIMLQELDFFKPLPTHTHGVGNVVVTTPPLYACETLARESVIGAEDMVVISDHILISGTDDRLRLWENHRFGPLKTPQGGLVAIYQEEEGVKVETLALKNFPAGVAFHPHGLYYHKQSQKLYAINHAYTKGGERIDVFHLSFKGTHIQKCVWKYHISSPLFCAEAMGALNDLVVLDATDGQDELYVTHYRPFPDSVEGRLVPGNVCASVHDALALIGPFLLKRRWTRVLYCKGQDCRATEGGDGGLMFNGIAISPDKERLLVADAKSIHVFQILPPLAGEGTHYRLQRLEIIPSPHVIDNIEPILSSQGDETYTAAAVGHIYQFVKHNARYSSQEEGERRTDFNITGGVLHLARDTHTHTYTLSEVFLQDGSGLSGVSGVGVLPHTHTHTQSDRFSHRYFFGSWSDRGVMVCDPLKRKEEKEEKREEL